MPPPSSGGVAVIETLAIYERARPYPAGAAVIDDWAAYLWASRLAYADRDFYIGDDLYVPVPTAGLVNPRYHDARARLVDLASAPREPLAPGDPAAIVGGASLLDRWWRADDGEAPGTTHFVVMDLNGDVVSMTATVESAFGAQRMAGGFFLNNQLTDFSFAPAQDGRPFANAVAPGKRPRSSMAPVIMLEQDGDFHAAIGSPGGGAIISYVSRTIIASEDWGLSLQEAVDLPHLISASGEIRMETGFPQTIAEGLAARGWRFRPAAAEDSGLHGFRVTPGGGLETAVDPRREGAVARVPRPAPRPPAG
jgi:gamma-glutamyltranspeptidase/glutathione hydrolase